MSPAVEKNTQMVNGDLPHSAFVDHLASYPLVSSGIQTYKSNTLGAHTIQLLNRTYEQLFAPLLRSPIAQDHIKPTVSPYLARADGFANNSLSSIDSRFPIVKSKPEELQSQLQSLLMSPLVFVDNERKWVYSIYQDQYKKAGGQQQGVDIFAASRALLGTGLVATSETLTAVASWLVEKKQAVEKEAKTKADSL